MSAREGLDRAALEQLYVRLEKPLFNVVYRWVWDVEAARDLVQDAFVRLWKHRASVDPATVEALAYRTALNLAANRRRAKRLWSWVTLEAVTRAPAPGPGHDEALTRAREQAEIRRAVDSLPEDSRRVLMLSEFAELKQEEIAAILKIPIGTVASRRHTAMRRLKEVLQRDEANENATGRRRPA